MIVDAIHGRQSIPYASVRIVSEVKVLDKLSSSFFRVNRLDEQLAEVSLQGIT